MFDCHGSRNLLLLLTGLAFAGVPCRAAAAPANMIEIKTKEMMLLEGDWFSEMQCSRPKDGHIVLQINQVPFRIPEASVTSVLLEHVPRLGFQDGQYSMQLLSDSGCPENPAPAVRIVVQPAAPGLTQSLVLSMTPPHEGLSQRAQTLLDLRGNAVERCLPTPNTTGFVTCGVRETSNGRSEPIVYVIATDKTMVLHSGAPLHLRCFVLPNLLCGIEDDLKGGVTFKIGLAKEDFPGMTPKKLAEIFDRMRAVVDGLRKTP
jgi:hypothetical protein